MRSRRRGPANLSSWYQNANGNWGRRAGGLKLLVYKTELGWKYARISILDKSKRHWPEDTFPSAAAARKVAESVVQPLRERATSGIDKAV